MENYGEYYGEKMREAAKQEDYETAAFYRDMMREAEDGSR